MFEIKFTDLGLADLNKYPEACSQELIGPLKEYRSFHFGKLRVIYRVFHDLKTVVIIGAGAHSADAKADIG